MTILARLCLAGFAGLAASGAGAQRVPDAEAARMLLEIRQSHIDGNVPDEADFERFLERDLLAWLAREGVKAPSVRFELLRKEPTQAGIAYPKYYLWVWTWSAGAPADSGAVRVAAVDKAGFDIREFLPRDAIVADPAAPEGLFPEALVEAIRARAADPAFPPAPR